MIPESEFESSGLVVDDLPATPAAETAGEVAVSNADVVGDAHVVLVTEVGAVEIETEASVLKPSEVHEERSGSQTDSGVGSLDSVGAGAGVGMAGSLNAGPDDRLLSSSSVSPLKSRFGSFRDVGSFLFSPFTVI